MNELRSAESAAPAAWLLRPDADWWDLVRYGPPGFDVYVRVAFAHPPEDDDDSERLRLALAILASFTATPATGYAAVWEGWCGTPGPLAPRIAIPHREMLLFTGPVDVLRDAPALAWYRTADGRNAEPHLVWPQDQTWCVACEVDEEIEFTVGCSVGAYEALAAAASGDVRRVRYGEPAPLYRDPPH